MNFGGIPRIIAAIERTENSAGAYDLPGRLSGSRHIAVVHAAADTSRAVDTTYQSTDIDVEAARTRIRYFGIVHAILDHTAPHADQCTETYFVVGRQGIRKLARSVDRDILDHRFAEREVEERPCRFEVLDRESAPVERAVERIVKIPDSDTFPVRNLSHIDVSRQIVRTTEDAVADIFSECEHVGGTANLSLGHRFGRSERHGRHRQHLAGRDDLLLVTPHTHEVTFGIDDLDRETRSEGLRRNRHDERFGIGIESYPFAACECHALAGLLDLRIGNHQCRRGIIDIELAAQGLVRIAVEPDAIHGIATLGTLRQPDLDETACVFQHDRRRLAASHQHGRPFGKRRSVAVLHRRQYDLAIDIRRGGIDHVIGRINSLVHKERRGSRTLFDIRERVALTTVDGDAVAVRPVDLVQARIPVFVTEMSTCTFEGGGQFGRSAGIRNIFRNIGGARTHRHGRQAQYRKNLFHDTQFICSSTSDYHSLSISSISCNSSGESSHSPSLAANPASMDTDHHSISGEWYPFLILFII